MTPIEVSGLLDRIAVAGLRPPPVDGLETALSDLDDDAICDADQEFDTTGIPRGSILA